MKVTQEMLLIALFLSAGAVWAAQPPLAVLPVPGAESAPQARQTVTRAEQKKLFQARRKLIAQLVKAYQKAPQAQKPALKAQLEEAVSQSMDEGLAYMKERVAAERANLENWEAKLKQDEANLPALKEQRVADLLSGDAKRKYKAARKAWKKQLKEARKKMR